MVNEVNYEKLSYLKRKRSLRVEIRTPATYIHTYIHRHAGILEIKHIHLMITNRTEKLNREINIKSDDLNFSNALSLQCTSPN